MSDDDVGGRRLTPPKPKPAAPAAPAGGGDAAWRAPGTRVGQAVRHFAEASLGRETALVNGLTRPFRDTAATAIDVGRAALGMAPRVNAGHTFAGFDAPRFPSPSAAAPAAGAALAGDGLDTPATDGVAVGAPALTRPAPVWNARVDPLRAKGASPAAETGVTLPGGRSLPYGAMVKGVPTFSDGSGGINGQPGSIPRTMTDAEMAGLGERLNTVPSTAFTDAAPAFNSENTEQNVQAILRSRQGGKFGITPDMHAASDLAAVVNQDPRSPLGRAALNASRRAGAAATVLQRTSALGALQGLQATVARHGALGIEGAGASDRANVEAQTALQRQGLVNQGELARQGLANEGEWARTDLAGKYDLLGALVKPNSHTGEMTDKDYLTTLNQGVQDPMKAYQDQQALLPAGQRQRLTDAMIAEMRAIQAKAMGLRVGTDGNGRRVMQLNGRVVPL
ncbi:MAG: hypothetical protein ACREPF_04980 [Rhodanobacteraceae bacterium]